ncbi:MAG: alpha/beta fold hydrolase [Pseudomonadota bacterium]
MRPYILLIAVLLTACTPRGHFAYAPPVEGAEVRDLWVARYRMEGPFPDRRSPPRPSEVTYEQIRISVPPGHAKGEIQWPDGEPNAGTDFVTLGRGTFDSDQHFAATVANADSLGVGETLLFVHGYNTNHAEATYYLAQIASDFDVPIPTVLFSWASAGVTAGYLYDRDSALIARDRLESVIELLGEGDRRDVIVMGHSMGGYLVMETLRQMALKGKDVTRLVDALILMSPDIDNELFRAQTDAIGTLPNPFVLLVAEQDKALRLSALLTGRQSRLGSQTDRSAVGDLPISVIDLSGLGTGDAGDHRVATTSPEAIALLEALRANRSLTDAALSDLIVLGPGGG